MSNICNFGLKVKSKSAAGNNAFIYFTGTVRRRQINNIIFKLKKTIGPL